MCVYVCALYMGAYLPICIVWRELWWVDDLAKSSWLGLNLDCTCHVQALHAEMFDHHYYSFIHSPLLFLATFLTFCLYSHIHTQDSDTTYRRPQDHKNTNATTYHCTYRYINPSAYILTVLYTNGVMVPSS